jgi:hypothetical protein
LLRSFAILSSKQGWLDLLWPLITLRRNTIGNGLFSLDLTLIAKLIVVWSGSKIRMRVWLFKVNALYSGIDVAEIINPLFVLQCGIFEGRDS